MKNYDLSLIEDLLKEKDLTMSEAVKELNETVFEITRLGLYAVQYVKTDEFRVAAESIAEVLYPLHMLSNAFMENNLQKFFATMMEPRDLNEALNDRTGAIYWYRNIITGLALSDEEEIHELLFSREEYVAKQITLLEELAAACKIIEFQSMNVA